MKGTSTTPVTPVVTTTAPATSITATSATLGGNVTTLGSPAPTGNGVVYSVTSTNNAPALGGGSVTNLGASPTATAVGNYTVSATGLTFNTGYSYRAYVTNSNGTVYGAVQTFTTATPAVTVSTAGPLALGSTVAGTAGSTTANYIVSGTNLTAALTVTPPAGVQLSSNGGTTYSAAGAALSFTQNASGTVVSQTITVRIAAAASQGSISAIIVNASTNAPQQDVAVTGTVTATPTASATQSSLTGFNYIETAGPSAEQTFDLSASNLTPASGNLSVTPTANYEVSLSSGSGFVSAPFSLPVPYTGGALAATTIHVRLKAALTAGSYNSNIIAITGGGLPAALNVLASGTVNKSTISASPASLALGSTASGTASLVQTYTLGGTFLLGNLVATPPVGVEISTDGFVTTTFTNAAPLTLTPTGNTVVDQTIAVRIAASAAGGSISSPIVHTSTTATTVNVALTGTVTGTLGVSPAGPFALGSTAQGTPGSTTASYTLSGTGLSGNVTVTAPTGFEIGTSASFGGGNANTLTLAPGSGSLSQLIYVRLSGAGSGSAGGNITHAASNVPGGSQPAVAVSGTVVAPVITVAPATLALGTVALNTPGAISTYTVSGSSLTASISITAPAGVELSLNGFVTSAATTLTLAQSGGTVANTTISVRLAASASAGALPGGSAIGNTSASTTQNVAVSGQVGGGSSVCLTDDFNSYTGGTTTASGSTASGLTFYTGSPQSGAAPRAASFDSSGDQLTTPLLATPASTLSFFVVGAATNATSSLLVEGFDGSSYVTIVTLNGFTTTGVTYTYSAGSTPALAQGTFTRFRFTYTKSVGNVGFDDLSITCGAVVPSLTLTTGTPSVAASYCVGQSPTGEVSFNLPYTVSGGSFGTGNVFTAYLSDAAGSFATNKKVVGTLTGVTSGTIPVTLSQFNTPYTLTTSSSYRLRVEGSTAAAANPVLASTGPYAVASYLDNEAIVPLNFATGSGTATAVFAAPTNCATSVVVTIRVGSTFGTKPLLGTTYTPGPGAGIVAFGTGTDLGGGQYVVYNGPASGTIQVTGLSNGTQYAFGIFTTNGSGYSDGVLRTVTPVLPATLSELIVPQFISGRPTTGSVHDTRLPYVWRATIGSLTPGATYRYYTAARATTTEVVAYGGVGVPIEVKTAGSFVRGSGPNFGLTTSTFTADASGNFTGWFALEPSADARFNDGSTILPMVVLNNGTAGNTTATHFLPTASAVTARLLGAGAAQATAVRGSSFGTASNFVLTYNNTAGTGRPLAGTFIENDGSDNSTTTNYAAFYSTPVNTTAGAYGLLTPNDNANGIRRIEQYSLATGLPVGCAATDADGTWPGGATTASPSTGTTAKVLTTGDTPFAAPTAGTISPANQQTGQTITITGTNFGTTPNPVITFTGGATATAATVNVTGTSLTVVVPAAAATGPVSIATSCGAAATTAGSLTIVPLVFYTVTGATDLSQLASFTANADGSVGLTPPSFSSAGQTFNILGTNRGFAANWTVSGTGAKVVLTAGTSLIIPTNFVLNGTLDQAAGSTLIIQNTSSAAITGLTQGVQDASSTIELAQTGAAYNVPPDFANAPVSSSYYLDYANLKLSGGQKRIPAVVVVNGNLTLENTIISGAVTNISATSASDYATIQLFGSLNQLTGVSYDATRSISLHLMNLTAVQSLNGNGNTIALYRLYTAASGAGVGSGANPAALGGRLIGSGSVLQVANSIDGGLALYEATASLALDAGTTLRFAPGGGGNFFVGTAGLLKPDPAANLEFYRNTVNSFTLGTLRLAPGFTTVNNFLLNSVAAGANTLTLTTDLTVNGTATLQAGTLIIGSNTLALNGSLAVATGGFLNGSNTSNLSVGGSGAFGTLSFASGARLLNNLTMNRSGGTLTLGAPLVVDNVLTLANGIVSTSATNLLTLTRTAAAAVSGGSTTSFINGPLARATTTGAATVFFPIGKGAAYRPLTLNTTAQSAARTYQAEQFNSTARTDALSGGLTRVSSFRYFSLNPVAATGTFSGTVTLAFGTDDFVNQPQATTFVVAKRPTGGGTWTNIGRTSATGANSPTLGTYVASGDLTSGVFTTFSDFTLATTDPNTTSNSFNTSNPLPVELLSFAATRTAAGPVALTWATATEKNSARFEVQRSLDGREFATIATVAAQGNSMQPTTYTTLDKAATVALLYYRLRQVDLDGTSALSPVVTVAGSGVVAKVQLYPNPAHSRISFITEANTPYRVLNQLGQSLLRGTTEAGTTSIGLEALPTGLYFLELQTATGRTVQKFEKN